MKERLQFRGVVLSLVLMSIILCGTYSVFAQTVNEDLIVNGKVGIGTTSIPAKLTLGSSSDGEYFRAIGTGGAYIGMSQYAGKSYLQTNGASMMWVGTADASPLTLNTWNSERMRIDSNGNVGIGTINPSASLEVSRANGGSNIKISNTDSGSAHWLILGSDVYNPYISSNSAIRFSTGGDTFNEKMRIDGNGNVGIGTTTPQAMLDVNGDIKAKSATFTGLTVTGKVQVQKVCFPDGSCLDSSKI